MLIFGENKGDKTEERNEMEIEMLAVLFLLGRHRKVN